MSIKILGIKNNLKIKFSTIFLGTFFKLSAMNWSHENTVPGGCPESFRILFAVNNYNFWVIFPDGRSISDTDLDRIRLARLGILLRDPIVPLSPDLLNEIRQQHRLATRQMVRDRQQAAVLTPDDAAEDSPPGGE